MTVQLMQQRRITGITHRFSHDLSVFITRRQGLSLLVVQILQAVFEVAQEDIGRIQIRRHLCRQLSVLGQLFEHALCGKYAQPVILSATYQLEHLCCEFNFPDPAGA